MHKIITWFSDFKEEVKHDYHKNPKKFIILTAFYTLLFGLIFTLCILTVVNFVFIWKYILVFLLVSLVFLPDKEVSKAYDLVFGGGPVEDYPVFVGYNGQRFIPEDVEKAFQKLASCFESFYFQDACTTENLIQYQFIVHSVSDKTPPKEKASLIQAIAEKTIKHYFDMNFMKCMDFSAITFVLLEGQNLAITYARNTNGISEIYHMREGYRKNQYEEENPVPMDTVITEKWEDGFSEEGMIPFGYDLQQYEDYAVKMPVLIPLQSHPHALIVGSSGSGKSKAIDYLMGKVLQACPDIDLWVCDFKKSEDFSYLEGYSHYFAGNDCLEGIRAYYKLFSEVRQSGHSDRRHLLVFDEYPACVLYFQGKDKQEKTKNASEILSSVGEILMLGRGINFEMWTVCQRASASIFPEGSRDNYMVSLSLGRISREQKGMLFPGEEVPERIFRPGEGILLADGHNLQAVKFPLVEDENEWHSHILSILASDGLEG